LSVVKCFANPAAHLYERGTAAQVLDAVLEKCGIVSPCGGNTLTKEVLHLYPEAVREHVGIGHDDDVDVFGICDVGFAFLLRSLESRLRRPAYPRSKGVALTF